MSTLIPASVSAISSSLTESQRELLPIAFTSFLDAATTSTGRATFYNTSAEQQRALESVHADLIAVHRGIYAATLMLPGVTDHCRQMGIIQLAQSRNSDAIKVDEAESRAIETLVHQLPAQRMLKLYGMLQQKRVNNARTRRLILKSILASKSLEFWAVKYRQKLRRALTHAWGRRTASILCRILAKPLDSRREKEQRIVRKHVVKYVQAQRIEDAEQCVRFVFGDERNLTLPRLLAYRDAKGNFERGASLPPEALEGLRSRFHPSRDSAEVLELTRSQMTRGQQIAVQRTAKEAGVKIDFDPSSYDAVRLYLYAFEMGMTDAIREALHQKAIDAAEQFPVTFKRIGVLLDASQSMFGHESQARRPIAVALALRDVLAASANEAVMMTSDCQTIERLELVDPSGDTSLAAGLVKLLQQEPEAVFVLSDGYENAPAGRFSQTVAAIRHLGISTPIHQLTPVFAAEAKRGRTLSDNVVSMPVNQPKAISLGLLKVMIEHDVDQGVTALLEMVQGSYLAPSPLGLNSELTTSI